MWNDVVKLILKEENILNKRSIIRSILSFFLLGILFINFIMPYLNIDFVSGKNIMPGLVLVTLYYSATFIYSKLKSKRTTLYKIIPFKNSHVFLGYMVVMFTNCILKKIIVFLLPVYVYLIINKPESGAFLAGDFIKITLITCITLFLSVVFSLEVFNKKIIVPLVVAVFEILMFNSYFYNNIILIIISLAVSFMMAIHFFNTDFKFINFNGRKCSRKKVSLLRREFIRFFNDKIILTNHMLTMIMIFFFTIGYVFLEGEINSAGYLILIMPGMITTLSIMFSSEKEVINLIKFLPINMKQFFIDKCIFLVAITIPYYVIAFTMLAASQIKGFNPLIGMLIIFNFIINCIVKVYFDYKKPFFKYSHMKMLIENKRRYYFYIISLILGAPVIGNEFIGTGLAFLGEAIIAAILFVVAANFTYIKGI